MHLKKSLKIPKGYSESVNRRRTDNTMASDLQNITQKTKYWTRGVSQKAVFSLCAYTSYSFNVFILKCDILLNWSTQIAAI